MVDEIQTVKPDPDPTERTIAQLVDALKAERDYVDSQLAIRDERLRGIDIATGLRLDAVGGDSGAIDTKLVHERELSEERFRSVAQQFVERDTRAERESKDNKVAVDAAFAAQKEAAAKQDEGNQKAIDKSETAMDEKVNKLEQLFKTTTDALADKIEDNKRRQITTDLTVSGLIQNGAGIQSQKVEQRAITGAQVALIGLAVAIIVALITVAVFVAPNPSG